MKATVLLLTCVVGIVLALDCLDINQCASMQCRYTSFKPHCLDNRCVCLSEPTGVNCSHTSDCDHAYHQHKHCAPGEDMEWHCSHDHMCHCIKD